MDSFSEIDDYYDAVIIGSGFGGSMTAEVLVRGGRKVLMVERGDWVPRGPENWARNASVDLTRFYDMESPVRVLAGGNKELMGLYSCVGGPSVFYGGVSLRFRQEDFAPAPEIVGESGAEWPISYDDLEPFYSRAESLLRVAGEAGVDPTEPPRSQPYPQQPAPLTDISRRVEAAAQRLGLHPFRLPLAINYDDDPQRSCVACTTCDTFACAVRAKNDLATVLLPPLIHGGLHLLPNTVATRLIEQNGRITSVKLVSRRDGAERTVQADYFILSAGSLASPQLLLASGLQARNPGGALLGHYLMRHVNAIVFGIFPGTADRESRFHKQLGIHDFYFGHPSVSTPCHKLGCIQQLQTPPAGLVEEVVPAPWGKYLSKGVKLLTGLLTIAEDQPQFDNFVDVDGQVRDRFGLPQLRARHHYSRRDRAALAALIRQAKKILRGAGAWMHYVHHIRTFSHAVGTVRMGRNPKTSLLDEWCRFRGANNLYVIDGSFMPTSAGLNPSLTISANALRVAEHLHRNWN